MNSLRSMCAVGEVKISASDFHQGDENVNFRSTEEAGGFVLWQKNPDSWCLELLVSGCKVISGSNGKVSWRQSSNLQTPISKGPPRPLRRFLQVPSYLQYYSVYTSTYILMLIRSCIHQYCINIWWQGLDPRSTANLFLDAVCIGEKIINDEDCFILKLDACKSALEAQTSRKYEIIHHTIWGYFSQKSGLLLKFEDSRLLTVKTKGEDSEGVFWETSTESMIEGYKYVDGVNIAHSGKTFVTVYRYGEQSANHKRELEEAWKIEEVDFNVWGLSADFFMPPSDIKRVKKS